MIYDGSKTVTNAGTRVTLAAATERCSWVQVRANSTNTGNIYLGGSTISSTRGIPLGRGEAQMLPFSGDAYQYDLLKIWIDSDVNSEGVTFNYGKPSYS